MPRSEDPKHSASPSRHDEFEDIEILKNLLELRTKLRREKVGLDMELE